MPKTEAEAFSKRRTDGPKRLYDRPMDERQVGMLWMLDLLRRGDNLTWLTAPKLRRFFDMAECLRSARRCPHQKKMYFERAQQIASYSSPDWQVIKDGEKQAATWILVCGTVGEFDLATFYSQKKR